jgi:hypothetical protein
LDTTWSTTTASPLWIPLFHVDRIESQVQQPPRTPKQRIEILRQAFDATMKDGEFLADAKKANLEIEPITGQEMERLVSGIFKLDPALAAKLKSILNPS